MKIIHVSAKKKKKRYRVYTYNVAYLQSGWDEIKVGKYEFPFALKVTQQRLKIT